MIGYLREIDGLHYMEIPALRYYGDSGFEINAAQKVMRRQFPEVTEVRLLRASDCY